MIEQIGGRKLGEFECRQMNIVTLAYMGDVVYDLYIRGKVVEKGDQKIHDIHREVVTFVNANAQADAVDGLMEELREAEHAIFLRGRNSKSLPTKNTDMAHYKKATGFESILGYLYMSGQDERLMYLLDKATSMTEGTRSKANDSAAR